MRFYSQFTVAGGSIRQVELLRAGQMPKGLSPMEHWDLQQKEVHPLHFKRNFHVFNAKLMLPDLN